MDQDIVKNQIGTVRSFWYILIIIGAVFIFTAPFWHINFPKQTKHITGIKEKLKESEDTVIADTENLWLAYKKGNITAENYIIQNFELKKLLEKLKSENSERLNREISNHKIFDWKTPRIFLIGFGTRLPYVVFSLVISLLIANRREDSKKLRIAFSFLQVSCWSISAYLMIWVFWYSDDYSLSTYRFAFVAISIFIGIAIAFFLSNYETTISALKSKIRYIMNLMINQAVVSGHVRDEDKYETEIIFPALKKLDE